MPHSTVATVRWSAPRCQFLVDNRTTCNAIIFILERKVPKLTETVNDGNVPGLLLVAMRLDMEISPPSEMHAILNRVQTIQTRGQAQQHLNEVDAKKTAIERKRVRALTKTRKSRRNSSR